MNKAIHLTIGLLFTCLVSTPLIAEKHLIFLDGYLGWWYLLPPYLVANHEKIEKLPFSGFVVVGNVYTSYVMSADPASNNVTFERVWAEVGSLKDVYKKKTDNFLRINLDFPGNFWDDSIWDKTTRNFAAVAKAAKNLGFKGILFDDEPYASGQHTQANFMSNFRFPKKQDVIDSPAQYASWEIKESLENRGDWVDYTCNINGIREENSENCSYRNLAYSFQEHMDKVALRFKIIMQAMQTEFPGITLLVLHGPATAHLKTNINGHYIKPNSIFETNEYKGAMFLGFKQGLSGNATLHDFGEFYQYKTDTEVQNAYQWRKYDITSETYNQGIDETFRWLVPLAQRASWSDVEVGFMVSDYGQPFNSRGGYNTEGLCTPADVEIRLTRALQQSDNYVIFYSDSSLSDCEADIRWSDIASTVRPEWLDMVDRVDSGLKLKEVVKRAELSKYILQAKYGIAYVPAQATGMVFDDIQIDDYNADWIEQLVTEGITEGCSATNFCPDMAVTKEQIAKMLLKAKYGAAYMPLPANGTVFLDIADDSFAADWIEALSSSNEAITSGCATSYYCPKDQITVEGFFNLLNNTFP